ncbi:MAG TPA: UbiA family prenyltransferase [Stellaceae bacterium]|jgi:1,4-dihydroxy-2-naphthoate octaprenyltransferase|nr:UbiA family prenyltransferase [Stellaceae bacterium]
MRVTTASLARLFQAARPENWWFSKIPPLLGVAYLEILKIGGESGPAVLLLGCYLFSISNVAAYGHVINDLFDIEADLRAGRHNTMAAAGGNRRLFLFLCAMLFLIGFAPTLLAHYSIPTILLLALNFLWPTLYSLPGIRLKERGLAGLLCDALGSHVTPTLVVLSVFGMIWPARSSLFFPIVVVTWSAALGLKGILHHQMLDRANDIRSGTVTFATAKLRPERMSRFMTFFNLFVELPVSAALVFATWGWAPSVAIAFVIYGALETAKYSLGFQFALTSETWTIRRSVPFTNETFYTVWLPLAAVVQLAARGTVGLLIAVAHVLLFFPNIAAQFNEIKAIVRVADLPNRLVQWLR